MSTDPFEGPGTSSGIDYGALSGALLLIQPHKLEEGIKTVNGVKDAVRGDVSVLDGEHKGEDFPDTLIFPGVLIGQLRTKMGKKVLGRLGQGEGKPGQNPPWKLADPTDADRKVGLAWLSGQLETVSTATQEPAANATAKPPWAS